VRIFQVDIQQASGGATVAVSGEIDLSVIEELDGHLAPILADSPDPLVIDLRQVTFVDSSGLRFLLKLNEGAKADARRFVLVAAGDPVIRVLQLAGVDGRLEVVADPADL
jgi:anti-anti-sigma factor